MSNPIDVERLFVKEVEEEMSENRMLQDAAGRIGAFGFLKACLPMYSDFLEDDVQ